MRNYVPIIPLKDVTYIGDYTFINNVYYIDSCDEEYVQVKYPIGYCPGSIDIFDKRNDGYHYIGFLGRNKMIRLAEHRNNQINSIFE